MEQDSIQHNAQALLREYTQPQRLVLEEAVGPTTAVEAAGDTVVDMERLLLRTNAAAAAAGLMTQQTRPTFIQQPCTPHGTQHSWGQRPVVFPVGTMAEADLCTL